MTPRVRFVTRTAGLCVALALVSARALAGQEAATAMPPLEPLEIALEEDTIRGGHVLLPVPLRRDVAGSRTVNVEVYRFQALAGAAPDALPIFVLNGGPGWPGAAPMLRDRDAVRHVLLPLLRIADVVTVGQRGIGTSTPTTSCAPPPPPTAGESLTAETRRQAHVEAARACRARWEAEGLDLRGYNVREAAADVDAARRALGYDRIQLVGGSFGSHWGMAVLRYHGDVVGRALLSSLEGPDHTYDDPAGVLAALRRIAAAAERDSAIAALAPAHGIVDGLATLIERLESAPVAYALGEGQVPVVIGAQDVRDKTLGYTGRASQRDGVASWPADMLRILRGEWAGLATRLAFERRAAGRLATASFFILDCGSGITAARHARYTSDPALRMVEDPAAYYDAICPVWDADLGDDFRTGFTTDVPTLLVHGTWDTSTPVENALELAPAFTDGHLVLVEGGTHGAFGEALELVPGFADAAYEFLRSGSRAGIPERVLLPDPEWSSP